MSKPHSILNDITINTLHLKNNIVVAPMSRVSTNGDGIPTEQMEKYYRRYAEGNFGLIITEGAYTDTSFSQAYPNQPGITNEKQQKGWENVAASVHQAGGKIILQLMHAGSLSQHLSHTRSASAIQPIRHMLAGYSNRQGRFPLPHAMNLSEIDVAVNGFAQAAIRAEKAGFDGVEIHAANGYLLDQFLTAYTNDREDQYGGTIDNRCRLTAKVISSVKQAVASDFIVGVRVSQGKVNDFDYTWPNGVDDGKMIFTALQKAGAGYIHFASEGKGFDHGCLTRNGESLTALAREITGLPVIANGGLGNPEEAQRILEGQHADLIALGTSALSNPDWPLRLVNNSNIIPFDPDMFASGVTISDQLIWEEKNP
jgi:2,4-dienoyl-CoA reductase-like NADH-dependent reductase (Old Yellow Enzyme family)